MSSLLIGESISVSWQFCTTNLTTFQPIGQNPLNIGSTGFKIQPKSYQARNRRRQEKRLPLYSCVNQPAMATYPYAVCVANMPGALCLWAFQSWQVIGSQQVISSWELCRCFADHADWSQSNHVSSRCLSDRSRCNISPRLISRGVVTHAMCGSISKCICLGYTYSKATVNHCLEMFGTYFPFREDEKSKDDGDSSTIIIKIVFQLQGSIHTTCDIRSLMFIQHTILTSHDVPIIYVDTHKHNLHFVPRFPRVAHGHCNVWLRCWNDTVRASVLLEHTEDWRQIIEQVDKNNISFFQRAQMSCLLHPGPLRFWA